MSSVRTVSTRAHTSHRLLTEGRVVRTGGSRRSNRRSSPTDWTGATVDGGFFLWCEMDGVSPSGWDQLNQPLDRAIYPMSTPNVWVLPQIGEVSTLSKDFGVRRRQNSFCCREKILWTRAIMFVQLVSNALECPGTGRTVLAFTV